MNNLATQSSCFTIYVLNKFVYFLRHSNWFTLLDLAKYKQTTTKQNYLVTSETAE